MNENDSYRFEVEQPENWEFSGEPTWISGWFLSKTGAIFSDLRAVIEGIAYPGLWALPRPDIEQRFPGPPERPRPGFSIQIRPPRGRHVLKLELRDAGGNWVEIWRKKIYARGGPGRRPRMKAGIIADQLRRLLQEHRARPDADLRPLARQLAREAATVAFETLPNPPFFGALEKPLLTGGSQFGKIRVEGWVIHREQPIRRLLATTHPLVENELDYGDRPRAEAAALFPDHPTAGMSQFFGMVDLDESAADPAYLQLWAELADGSRHLLFLRRFYQRVCNRDERPLPPYSRGLLLRIVGIFLAACRHERVRLGRWRDAWRGIRRAEEIFGLFAPNILPDASAATTGYARWLQVNTAGPRLRDEWTAAARTPETTAQSCVLVIDTRGCSAAHVTRLARSLCAQHHQSWEAWFVGDAVPAVIDARIHRERCTSPKAMPRALNAAAHASTSHLLAYLHGDDQLAPDALLEVAVNFAARPELELVYTDEDRIDDHGKRTQPVFKPDWSPALADSGLFPGRLTVVRRERFLAVGSFRDDYFEIPWDDLLWRVADTLTENHVWHLALIGCHVAATRSVETDPSHPAVEQTRQSLADTARRRGWAAAPFLPETGHHRRQRYHQWRWDSSILARLPVTIVIPTRDKLHLLQECVELLDETVDWRHAKLVIVDDHSRDADAVRYLERIQQRTDLRCLVVRPEDRAAPFNYSHLVNLARPHLDTPLVVHLNNDVNALERGWLEEMAGWFTLPDVGVVGARLVCADKTLNHTGIIIGPHGGLADTPYAKVPAAEIPVADCAAAREVSAVTGACLMTRTELYGELGGFDETSFGVAYNDVDYCLRVRATGRRVIYTPQALLMHWGSATRGVTFDDAEHIAFVRRYPGYRDPYFNPNLALVEGRPQTRGERFARSDRAGRLRLLLISHNLNYEGAPLFLLEYAAYMAGRAGFQLEVLAAQDGPLRQRYEQLGAHITLIDAAPLFAATDAEVFHCAVDEIAHRLDWDRVDLVVCNTLQCFWGVHLARSAARPSLLYIHESTSIFRFFEEKLRLELHGLVHEAFQQATRALFLCAATRAYYEDDNLRGNFRIVPSWIHLERIEAHRAAHPRAELRRRLGFAEDETIIANIGTVCERKGQHIFLRALADFNRCGHPGKFRFLMVGARPGIYLDLLQRDLDRLAPPNVTLVPETDAAYDYFAAADVFVCTSYEESFPRVVMEAMGFRTPIVSTDVHGIAEMIGQRQQGYLVPPGDPAALARMIWTCIAKERSGKTLTDTAFSKALRIYDYEKVLPVHVAQAREACLSDSNCENVRTY
ncbi:MAG: putative teichuronic acid biosynthesis glycosyltransferase TuaC [Verrucomicrobiota bacterium]